MFAIISENQKAKQGGISFDVILKPATAETMKPPIQFSSLGEVKKRELSQEQIENKLKKAEQRRSVSLMCYVFVLLTCVFRERVLSKGPPRSPPYRQIPQCLSTPFL